MSEEEFGPGGFASNEFFLDTARRINFVWILAKIHRHPKARRLLDLLVRSLAPRRPHWTGPHRRKSRGAQVE